MFVLNDFNSKKNTFKYSNSVNIFVYIHKHFDFVKINIKNI